MLLTRRKALRSSWTGWCRSSITHPTKMLFCSLKYAALVFLFQTFNFSSKQLQERSPVFQTISVKPCDLFVCYPWLSCFFCSMQVAGIKSPPLLLRMLSSTYLQLRASRRLRNDVPNVCEIQQIFPLLNSHISNPFSSSLLLFFVMLFFLL